MIIVKSREEFLNEVKKDLHSNIDAIEIGVFRGDFSKMIWDILKPYSLGLVDPFNLSEKKYKNCLTVAYSTEEDYQLVLKRFENEIREKRIYIDRRYSDDAVKYYENDCFDFIYLDGSHLYGDIKRDLYDWLPKLNINGSLCGHDYKDFEDFGVKQAVDEIIDEYDIAMEILNENGGDFCLRLI
jgi:hypothetical protein